MKTETLKKDIDSRGRFVDIGLENVNVAAARVTDLPPRCSSKEVKSVDVCKTSAEIIFPMDQERTRPGR